MCQVSDGCCATGREQPSLLIVQFPEERIAAVLLDLIETYEALITGRSGLIKRRNAEHLHGLTIATVVANTRRFRAEPTRPVREPRAPDGLAARLDVSVQSVWCAAEVTAGHPWSCGRCADR